MQDNGFMFLPIELNVIWLKLQFTRWFKTCGNFRTKIKCDFRKFFFIRQWTWINSFEEQNKMCFLLGSSFIQQWTWKNSFVCARDLFPHKRRIFFLEILLNPTVIRLYLPFSDWFEPNGRPFGTSLIGKW